MKLLTYTIGGQKIGIDIITWNDTMLSGNTAFLAIADTGSTPTDYVDVSSTANWDNFGAITTLTAVEIKEEIIKLIPNVPTAEEYEILEGYINVGINSIINIDDNVTLSSLLTNGSLSGITDTKMATTGSTDSDFEVNTISGQSGVFFGDYRIEGKLWTETIRRVKQEANQLYIRINQDSGLAGGNYAGLTIFNPTGATTGATIDDNIIPYYVLGVNKDGILVAGWSGDTQPVVRGNSSGVYGSEFQLASALAETTTTSATPQTKVTLTTTDLPSGTYKIFTAWIAGSSSAQNDMIFDVTLNGTPQGTISSMNIESKDIATHNTLSRTFYLSLSGVNNIVLRYSSESGNTTRISDATIELIRVE